MIEIAAVAVLFGLLYVALSTHGGGDDPQCPA